MRMFELTPELFYSKMLATKYGKKYGEEAINKLGFGEITQGLIAQMTTGIGKSAGPVIFEKMVEFVCERLSDSALTIGGIRDKYASGEYSAEVAMQKLHNSYDNIKDIFAPKDIKNIFKQHPPVCKKGCNGCCAMSVSLIGPEVEFIKSIATPEQIAHAALVGTTEEDSTELWKFPFKDRLCPFNSGGECTIYDKRPLVCRNMMVTDRICVDEEDDQVAYCATLSAWIFKDTAAAIMGGAFLRSTLSGQAKTGFFQV